MSTAPRCPGCTLRSDLCICAVLPRLHTRTRVSVVMHKMESVKPTNTGQLAVRCLHNAQVHLFGNDLPALPEDLWPPGARPVVLFPIAGARPITEFRGEDPHLVVLDASWRQAVRLRKRFARRNIPFAQLPPGAPSMYALRAEPHERGVCTLEAIARALQALEGGELEAELLRALRVFQDRRLWLRGTKAQHDVEGGIPAGVLRHTMTP